MTKDFGKFLIVTGRSSEKSFRVWMWLSSPNTWRDMFDAFGMDWGSAYLSFHIFHWRADVCYRYGRKHHGIPYWARHL